MPTIEQAPGTLDLIGVGGSPFAVTFTVTVKKPTGTAIPWATVTTAALSIPGHATSTPAVTSPGAGQWSFSLSPTDTAAIQRAGGAAWSLEAHIAGSGPFSIIAGTISMRPATTPGSSSEAAAAVEVTTGGGNVALTVTLGGSGSGGTVTTVEAANGTISVSTGSTTPKIEVVTSPKIAGTTVTGAPSAAGKVLLSSGPDAAGWTNPPAPTGTAGGDLSGTFPDPTVAKLNGVPAADFAELASPAFTGTPTAPTAAALTDSTQLATTAYTDAAVAVETARAEGVENAKAAKASPALTGTPTAPTAAPGTNTTQIATTAYADAAVAVEKTRAQTAEALKAPLASPALTGTPTAPTAAPGTNTTQIATTAFVEAAASSAGTGYYGPVPTGVAATDTAAVQTAINTAHAAGKTCLLTQPGTFKLNAKVTLKGPIVFGDSTQTFEASTTFPIATPMFATTPTTTFSGVSWGSCTFHGNHRAKNCLVINKMTKPVWIGRPTFRTAQQHTLVIGNATGGGFRNAGALNFTGAKYQAGYASLRVNCSDCQILAPGGHGQETGIWVSGSDNYVNAAHFSNTGILQGYRDTGSATRWRDCIGDSYGAATHAVKTTTGSSVVTDAHVLAIHQGLRVTGAGIPAGSYIGAVTTGSHFTLVNKTGAAVNATATATPVTLTLVATHFSLQGRGSQVSGGLCQAVVATSGGADAFNFGPSVTTGGHALLHTVGPMFVWGHSTALAFARAFSGNLANARLASPILQVNVTTTIVPTGPLYAWTLSTDVTIPLSTLTVASTSASLPVGTYLVSQSILVQGAAANTAFTATVKVTGGTATYTVLGGESAQQAHVASLGLTVEVALFTLSFLVRVTAPGTITFKVLSTKAAKAKAKTPKTTLAGATGGTAIAA